MITVSRTFTVAAPVPVVLDYLKDFGNTTEWDPATRLTTRAGSGPVAVGASWHTVSKVLGVRTELTYTLLELGRDRLVFVGRNEGATSTDTITVRPDGTGTEVTYHLELEMHGLAKLATPVLRAEFGRLGDETAARLTEVLDRLARSDVPG